MAEEKLELEDRVEELETKESLGGDGDAAATVISLRKELKGAKEELADTKRALAEAKEQLELASQADEVLEAMTAEKLQLGEDLEAAQEQLEALRTELTRQSGSSAQQGEEVAELHELTQCLEDELAEERAKLAQEKAATADALETLRRKLAEAEQQRAAAVGASADSALLSNVQSAQAAQQAADAVAIEWSAKLHEAVIAEACASRWSRISELSHETLASLPSLSADLSALEGTARLHTAIAMLSSAAAVASASPAAPRPVPSEAVVRNGTLVVESGRAAYVKQRTAKMHTAAIAACCLALSTADALDIVAASAAEQFALGVGEMSEAQVEGQLQELLVAAGVAGLKTSDAAVTVRSIMDVFAAAQAAVRCEVDELNRVVDTIVPDGERGHVEPALAAATELEKQLAKLAEGAADLKEKVPDDARVTVAVAKTMLEPAARLLGIAHVILTNTAVIHRASADVVAVTTSTILSPEGKAAINAIVSLEATPLPAFAAALGLEGTRAQCVQNIAEDATHALKRLWQSSERMAAPEATSRQELLSALAEAKVAGGGAGGAAAAESDVFAKRVEALEAAMASLKEQLKAAASSNSKLSVKAERADGLVRDLEAARAEKATAEARSAETVKDFDDYVRTLEADLAKTRSKLQEETAARKQALAADYPALSRAERDRLNAAIQHLRGRASILSLPLAATCNRQEWAKTQSSVATRLGTLTKHESLTKIVLPF